MTANKYFTGFWRALVRNPSFVAAVLSLLLTMASGGHAALAEDDLAGTYYIEGWDPGKDPTRDAPYRGTGTIERRGGAYFYKGKMEGHDYSGVGLYDPSTETLALNFREDESGRTGVAQYRHSDGDLVGNWVWTDDAEGKIGKEVWSAE